MIMTIALTLVAGLILNMLYATHRGRPLEFHAWGLHLDTKRQPSRVHDRDGDRRTVRPTLWVAIGIVATAVWQWLSER